MKTLLISADGQLGASLYKRLGGFATSRHGTAPLHFDLKDSPAVLPEADTVYLVAAKTKFRDCEMHPDAWAVNVDAPIRIAARFPDAFIVYVSSEAATWPNQTAYGSQKRAAELGLLSVCGYNRLAIVRPAKITPDRIDACATVIAEAGLLRKAGVHTWT